MERLRDLRIMNIVMIFGTLAYADSWMRGQCVIGESCKVWPKLRKMEFGGTEIRCVVIQESQDIEQLRGYQPNLIVFDDSFHRTQVRRGGRQVLFEEILARVRVR